MLAALDIGSVDELFDDIPEALRAGGLDLPPPQPEMELAARLQELAARNRVDLASFLGAGVYRHFAPAAVDQMLLRGEWYTAYTPYQPEVSQGTLQSIYEYESLIGELLALDVVSASHYDGATASAEAAMMAVRQTRRSRHVCDHIQQCHLLPRRHLDHLVHLTRLSLSKRARPTPDSQRNIIMLFPRVDQLLAAQ